MNKTPTNFPEGGESHARKQVLPFGEDLGGAMNESIYLINGLMATWINCWKKFLNRKKQFNHITI